MTDGTVLITGINGFIGSHLSRVLRERFPGVMVCGLELRDQKNADHTYHADLLDRPAVITVLRKVRPDVIYHLAGAIFSREWQDLYQGNVAATINLLESVAQELPSCRIVIPGSAAEYGRAEPSDLPLTEIHALNPVSPYGVAKAWQTTVARYFATRGLEVVIGRIFNVIGRGIPANLSIGAFLRQLEQIKRGELASRISVGNLAPRRDFIDVDDACTGLIALAGQGKRGEVYNICSGTSVSMENILSLMMKSSGVQASLAVDPQRFHAADIEDIYGSHEKAHTATGWSPSISLQESVSRLFENAGTGALP